MGKDVSIRSSKESNTYRIYSNEHPLYWKSAITYIGQKQRIALEYVKNNLKN